MQLLIRKSKLVVLAVLSCSLLITWNSNNTEVTGITIAIPAIQSLELASGLDFPRLTLLQKPDLHAATSTKVSALAETTAPVVSVATQKTNTLSVAPTQSTPPIKIAPATKETPKSSPAKQPTESIWTTLSREFNLDRKAQSARVKAEIRKLLADQAKFYSILKAASPYIYFIHNQTKAKGLPAEIALIPVIESEYNPNDHSSAGATGLWQLMPTTARELGVKVKSNYDGRRNVIASTKAALAYFKDLGKNFKGNWHLAIGAYNCGHGKMRSLARRTGSRDFWKLPVPQETKYYVPKLLAVAEIVKNPQKYGIKLPPITNAQYFTELKIKKPVDLARIAKSSGIDIKALISLNPDYKHGSHSVVPNKGAYTLLVPTDKLSAVKAQLGKNIISS